MSLVQHVSQLEGQDREEALVDLFLPPLERVESIARSDRERRLSLGSGFDATRTVRRLASYDYLQQPDDTIEEYSGGVTQYNVSTVKRIGSYKTSESVKHNLADSPCSPGNHYSASLLVRKRHRLRLRCTQANSDQGRRLPGPMYPGRAGEGRRGMLRTGPATQLLLFACFHDCQPFCAARGLDARSTWSQVLFPLRMSLSRRRYHSHEPCFPG